MVYVVLVHDHQLYDVYNHYNLIFHYNIPKQETLNTKHIISIA